MKTKHFPWTIVLAAAAVTVVITTLWVAEPPTQAPLTPTIATEAPSTPAPTIDRPTRPEPSSATEIPPTPAPAQQRIAPRTVVASTDVAPSPDKGASQFRDWFSRFQKETDAASKARLEAEGEALAKQRREVMARLIEEDPQRALEEAIPFAERQ